MMRFLSPLAIIYVAFISLGLPDTLLGVAWPSMRTSLGVPLNMAGYLVAVTTLSTAFASFFTRHITKVLSLGMLLALSTLLTAISLIGFTISPSIAPVFAFGIILGLGAGAVDTALNHHVAANYSASEMNWLHCFWGIGALSGPLIISACYLGSPKYWKLGYLIVAFIQLLLAALYYSRRKQFQLPNEATQEMQEPKSLPNITEKSTLFSSVTFFPVYIGIEMGIGVWITSYLLDSVGVSLAIASVAASTFFGFITAGRFFTGIIAKKSSCSTLMRMGMLLLVAGALMLLFGSPFMALVSVPIMGLGCAPMYPCMMHTTGDRFDAVKVERVIGFQVGTAYLGGCFLLPVLGYVIGRFQLSSFPWLVLALVLILLPITEFLIAKNKVAYQ